MHCQCGARRGALRTLGTALAATLALALPAAAPAADWPARPVTLVVPQGAGSGSDVVARLLAVHMGTALGQSVVVDNRTGGGGIIAHQAVARAQPDGYTLLLSSTAQLLVVPAMNSAARYQLDDFAPVAPVLRAPFAILVANTPAAPKTLRDLVEQVRSQPAAYASAGTGTMTHLGSEIFLRRAGLKATHVPYKGSGAALTDLIGGQVLFATDSLTAALTHVRSGKLRVLAVTGTQRLPSLPDAPTTAEAGYAGVNATSWFAVFAPAATPKPVIDKLTADLKKVVENPAFKQKAQEQGATADYMSPQQLGAMVKTEWSNWAQVVKSSKIEAE